MSPNFDFIGRKKIWFSISAFFMAIGLIYIAITLTSYLIYLRSGKQPSADSVVGKVKQVVHLTYGVEFKGGTIFDLKFKKQAKVEDIRGVLRKFKLEKSVIQPLGRNEFLIKCPSISGSKQQQVKQALGTKFGLKDTRYIQGVGPGWGANVTRAAALALLLSFAGLLVYVSFRFEFKMAVCALLALFHDILIVVGVYGLVGREVTPSTVAALLTILGYSLYDTIVIFHRVLENTPKITKQTYSSMVNTSINQVLVRSINTSLTTIIPVTVILFLGGETLKDFAFALFVGITSGAYSSIFTASPLLSLWKEREPRYRALREKYGNI